MPTSVFLTGKFKVHNPSKRKQAALDTELEQYTYAYQYLLDWCRENLDTLEEKGQSNGRYRETLIRGSIASVLCSGGERRMVEPKKESRTDLIMSEFTERSITYQYYETGGSLFGTSFRPMTAQSVAATRVSGQSW